MLFEVIILLIICVVFLIFGFILAFGETDDPGYSENKFRGYE